MKGASLATLLDSRAIECLAYNISQVYPNFASAAFRKAARRSVEGLGIMPRGVALAEVLHEFLPPRFDEAAGILVASLGPPLQGTSGHGLAPFFYLPHTRFVSLYGVNSRYNEGRDPFESAMQAQHEMTRRFTAEFSIRRFLIADPDRTLKKLLEWTLDPDPHVRRLCSEGTRARLPWAERLPMFIKDPKPTLPILEALKDDADLYVRRSVANHIGDIAKDHPALAVKICRGWLRGASAERFWVIRHAMRYHAKKGQPDALEVRRLAARR